MQPSKIYYLCTMIRQIYRFLAISTGLFVTYAGGAQRAASVTERNLVCQGMVTVHSVDSTILTDLMYTRADNFTGRVLYTDLHTAYLHPEAAKALAKAQLELKRLRPDLTLKVYDAARPMHIQQKMWNVVAGTPKHIYVSNPKNGGGLHNYGLAVDVTLSRTNGDTLHMGTLIDHLGPLAHIDTEEALVRSRKLTAEAVKNRRLLRQVMQAAGFRPLRTEWWHFNLRSRAEAKAHYKVIK